MSGKWNGKRVFHIFVLVLVGIAVADLLLLRGEDNERVGENGFSWKAALADQLGQEVLDVWLPAFSFAGQKKDQAKQQIEKQDIQYLQGKPHFKGTVRICLQQIKACRRQQEHDNDPRRLSQTYIQIHSNANGQEQPQALPKIRPGKAFC